jgi:misacylated tRNA(Ala) deacylase
MTQLLYQLDSYQKQFPAVVLEQDHQNHAIILDQTAFYPGGGGQPCDTGALKVGENLFPVPRLKKVNNQILHFIDSEVSLPEVGSQVTGLIDWDRRYQLMRTHTALHILCGVVFRDYGAQVTGGDMDPLQGRMDFEFESMHKELVETIQADVNREVAAARPVEVRILPRQEAFEIPDLIRTKINLLPPGIPEVRVVEIKGLDLQADGGTHVQNTAEVGVIQVRDYKSKGKINKRIYIQLGEPSI